MKKLIEKHFISLAIVVVLILVLVSAFFSFYNKLVMEKALLVQTQTDMIRRETENAFLGIRQMDISSRGYALIPEESFLFYSVEVARATNLRNFHVLDSLFSAQGYSDPENYNAMKASFSAYVDMYEVMVGHLNKGELEEYKFLLANDEGRFIWPVFDRFTRNLYAYQDALTLEANQQYESAVFRNTLVQILLLIIGLPTLAGVLYRMRREAQKRKALLQDLEENNRKYLFNSGDSGEKGAKEILETSILNLQKAAEFVNQISQGNYEAQWEQLNEDIAPLNQENLAGRLVLMREQMKRVKQEDEKRLWATEGLTRFSELIRNHQHDLNELTFQALKFLVKYLSAQQGSVFILQEEEGEQPWLQLVACYAFDRKKWVDKRFEIGEGLVGQTYLEGETVVLTEVPQAYTYITSGLGDATPRCIVLVPMKYNERVQAIIELASFKQYGPEEIALLEKTGEFMASAIATAQTNEKTSHLLSQLQAQTEQMRAQEEELRQNMEELEATQEEMRRKEMAMQKQLAALDNK